MPTHSFARPLPKTAIQAFAGLGSNSEDAVTMLARAREGLAALPYVSITAASPVYVTEPQGYANQPWFHNQVLALAVQCPKETEESAARRLMQDMLAIEAALGRVRSPDPALRFGPRCIDIDLLLFGAVQCADPFCTVPHPRLAERAFWLVPLRDIAPGVLIWGRTPQTWLASLNWHMEADTISQH